ncbi:hypothetical protein ELX64_27570 (plasmid) [Escherichia coli]|nr:hypothetical protein ELX64_27570 [Escherichia coli]
MLTPRVARCQPGCNKINFVTSAFPNKYENTERLCKFFCATVRMLTSNQDLRRSLFMTSDNIAEYVGET